MGTYIGGKRSRVYSGLHIAEFDYVLLTNSSLDKHECNDIFENALSQMTKMKHHPNLAIQSMNLNTRGRFPCLYITWVDAELRNTHISIDLIQAIPLQQQVTLPHHNFLPVPRVQQPGNGDVRQHTSLQGCDMAPSNDDDMPSIQSVKLPGLFSEGTNTTVFSQVENGLITALPIHVFEGYRLAKAFRISLVIKPIIQDPIRLDVTLDIHRVIRTYHLKTSVFYLTKNYVYDDLDIIAVVTSWPAATWSWL